MESQAVYRPKPSLLFQSTLVYAAPEHDHQPYQGAPSTAYAVPSDPNWIDPQYLPTCILEGVENADAVKLEAPEFFLPTATEISPKPNADELVGSREHVPTRRVRFESPKPEPNLESISGTFAFANNASSNSTESQGGIGLTSGFKG